MKILMLTGLLVLATGLNGCQNLQLGASPIPVIAYDSGK